MISPVVLLGEVGRGQVFLTNKQSQDMILTHICEVIAMGKRKPCLHSLPNAVGPQRVKMAPSQVTEEQSGERALQSH